VADGPLHATANLVLIPQCLPPPQLIHHTGMNGGTNAKELEATLGLKLEHPNIVRTFDFATRSSGSVRPLLFVSRLRIYIAHIWL
jgi:hypothetical protein